MSIDTIGPFDKTVEGHHYGLVCETYTRWKWWRGDHEWLKLPHCILGMTTKAEVPNAVLTLSILWDIEGISNYCLLRRHYTLYWRVQISIQSIAFYWKSPGDQTLLTTSRFTSISDQGDCKQPPDHHNMRHSDGIRLTMVCEQIKWSKEFGSGFLCRHPQQDQNSRLRDTTVGGSPQARDYSRAPTAISLQLYIECTWQG